MANVELRSRVFMAVDAASEDVLREKRENMDYLRYRPMGDAGGSPAPYRFRKVDIQEVAQMILTRTQSVLGHPPLTVSRNYPPQSRLVSEMNADLIRQILKAMSGS